MIAVCSRNYDSEGMTPFFKNFPYLNHPHRNRVLGLWVNEKRASNYLTLVRQSMGRILQTLDELNCTLVSWMNGPSNQWVYQNAHGFFPCLPNV